MLLQRGYTLSRMDLLFTLISKTEGALLKVDNDKKKSLLKTLDIDFQEKAAYLDLNAQTHASGKLDLETSQWIYNKLRDYESATLAERIVLTEFMMSLLKDRMANRK